MKRGWMAMLAWSLRRAGFAVQTFLRHGAVGLHENAARLDAFLKLLAADTVHLVGHSLGGW